MTRVNLDFTYPEISCRDASLLNVLIQISQEGGFLFGVEARPDSPENELTLLDREILNLSESNITLEDLLVKIKAAIPDFQWEVSHHHLLVQSLPLLKSENPLETKIKNFSFKGTSDEEFVSALNDSAPKLMSGLTSYHWPPPEHPYELALRGTHSIREIINEFGNLTQASWKALVWEKSPSYKVQTAEGEISAESGRLDLQFYPMAPVGQGPDQEIAK